MWAIDLLIGAVTGVLSGFGIGGGTLLILWLTLFGGMNQLQAGGVNLAYFICSGTPALFSHIKNKLVEKNAFLFCTLAGVPACILASIAAANIDVSWLRRGFGVLLLFIGFKELFSKQKKKDQNEHKHKEKTI